MLANGQLNIFILKHSFTPKTVVTIRLRVCQHYKLKNNYKLHLTIN